MAAGMTNMMPLAMAVTAVLLAVALFAVAVGMLAGVASMLLYRRLSPQERLRQLKSESASVQQQLHQYDGEFAGAWALICQNLTLSFRRLGCAVGPSLVASLPLLMILLVESNYYLPFFVAMAVGALSTKFALRIA